MFKRNFNLENEEIRGGKVSLKTLILVSVCIILGGFITYVFLSNETIQGLINKGLSGVKISSFAPSGEVDAKTNFQVEFSHNMVEVYDVGVELDSTPVIYKPEIPGKFKWISTNKLGFFPVAPLKPATRYDAEVSADIAKVENRHIQGKRKFEFHTAPLKVVHSRANWVYDKPGIPSSKVQCDIEFNYRVEPEELTKYLAFYSEEGSRKTEISFGALTGEPSQKFTVLSEPVERQENVKKIRILISKGLVSVEGPLGLADDYYTFLNLETNLKVYSVASREEQSARYISIEFSSPVDAKLAVDYITVDPDVEFRIEPDRSYLKLKGNFKANQYYTVLITKGLTAVNGTVLQRDFSQRVKIGHFQPSLNFQTKGVYLPRKGSRKVAVESRNVGKISIEVEKIYINNLVYLLHGTYSYDDEYYYDYSSGNLGRTVFREEKKLDTAQDSLTVTPIDVGRFYDEGRKGLFRISVRDIDQYWTGDSMLVMITDLGIVANMLDDDMYVWVNSLSTLSSMRGVEISLLSANNQVIATGRTGTNGVLVIENLKSKLAEEQFTPYVITAKQGEDISFLRFDDCRMSTASFDVDGRELLTSGYEAYLYTDRGVFRPNDKAHFAAIVRGVDVSVPKSFPIKLAILDPQDRPFDESLKTINEGGLTDFDLIIPDYAMTGNYLAKLLIGEEEIGRIDFIVEDFIPNKTKVKVETDRKAYQAGETVQVDISGQYLFGPPASGREVESKLSIKSSQFNPTRWAGYTFGDADRKFDKTEMDVCKVALDENGKSVCKVTIPKDITPSSALKGVVSATLKEYGGRAVSAYSEFDIHPYPYYIGLKPKSKGYADTGKPYDVEFVTVNPDGGQIKRDTLEVKVYKIIYNTLLRRESSGSYQYISERSDQLLKTFTIDPGKTNTISYTPDDYGRYKLTLTDPDGRTSSAIMFYASGWGYAPWSMENPARIDIEVEKKQYRDGENAKLLIKSPFPGKLLLTVQREKVFDYKIVDMKQNTATMEISIKANYLPNIYVTATVIKSLDKYDGKSPLRAFGIVPVMVDTSEKKLDIEISAPTEMRPGKNLDLNLKVKNQRGVSYLTVAAVDEGILQLTDFETPDPFDFFYGKKRFDGEYYDIFSFVLPDLDKFNSQPAGDGYEDEGRRKHLSPVGIKRVEPVSLWSGIIKTDSSGNAKIKFKVPQFQGRLRVMAVAANASNIGANQKDVLVRDKIVIDPTLPRFLSSGDEFSVPVTIFNGTGKDGKFDISIQVDGPVTIDDKTIKTVDVAKGKESAVSFKCKAGDAIGKASFTVKASGMGEKTQDSANLPIRPASPVITKTDSNTITEKKPLELKLPGGFVDGTQDTKLIVSSFPEIQFTGGLQYLLGYPHGCVEQTTSKVFPLLYFDQLAKAAEPEMFKANSVWYFVQEGINKLVSLQQSDGSFSYWPDGRYTNYWSSIYAAHFLVEARKAGYQVPGNTYDDMILWLKSYTKRRSNLGSSDNYFSLQCQVYACYVLSLAGDPPKTVVNYIKDNKMKDIPVSSQYQLALCYFMMGDKKTAQELLPADIHPVQVKRETGGNFNSPVRENAIILDVLYEINHEHPGIPVLVKELTDSIKIGRWGSTQDNAFALMAIGKVLKNSQKAKFTGSIIVDGNTYKQFDDKGLTLRDKSLSGKTLKINIKGTGTCYIYWQAWGVPLKPDFNEYDKGIKVSREFLDINGKQANYKAFKHGELLVAKITAQALDKDLENVVIDDMLPAGFEIENPRLASSAEISWVKEKSYIPNYMDIRDDRVLLFTSLNHNQPITCYYVVRAVTSGTFILPPVSAECMYDSTYTSVRSSGKITVVE